MRIFLFGFLFIVLTFPSFGQNNFFRDKYGYYDSNHYGYGISAGIFQADFKSMNSRMRSLGATQDFGSSYYTVGLQTVVPMGGRYGESEATICMEAFLPKKVDINDSLHFSFSGFHIMTCGWGKDLIPDSTFDFVVSTGIDWGMAYYKENNPEAPLLFRNFFISPLARVEFHYAVKHRHIEFGIRAVYRYDVTAHHWKNYNDGRPSFNGNGFSGLGFEFFIARIHIAADEHNTENQFAPPVEQH
jgi:hypothetical protein